MSDPSLLVTPSPGAERLTPLAPEPTRAVAGRTPWQLFSERFREDKVAVAALGFIGLAQPRHSYTEALLSAVPVPSLQARTERRLVLRGDEPSPIDPPPACRFHTRCPKAQYLCRTAEPPLEPKGPGGQLAACHFPLTGAEAAELVPPAAAVLGVLYPEGPWAQRSKASMLSSASSEPAPVWIADHASSKRAGKTPATKSACSSWSSGM